MGQLEKNQALFMAISASRERWLCLHTSALARLPGNSFVGFVATFRHPHIMRSSVPWDSRGIILWVLWRDSREVKNHIPA